MKRYRQTIKYPLPEPSGLIRAMLIGAILGAMMALSI
jgi:hypothetical protein